MFLKGILADFESFSQDEDGRYAKKHSGKDRYIQVEALTLTEEQLIELLHKASHAGVLSQGFIGKLREKIAI